MLRRRPSIDRKGAVAPKVGHLGDVPLPRAPAPLALVARRSNSVGTHRRRRP